MKDYSDSRVWEQFYREKEEILAEKYEKVSAVDFYSDIFGDYINTSPSNFEFSLDTKPEDRRGKPIVRYKGEISDFNSYKEKLINDNKRDLELELEQVKSDVNAKLLETAGGEVLLELGVDYTKYTQPVENKYKIKLEKELDRLAEFYQTGKYQRYTDEPNEYSERGTKKAAETKQFIDRCVDSDLGKIKEMRGKKTAYMAPITYFNNKASSKNAHFLHAIVIDIDMMTSAHLSILCRWIEGYEYDTKAVADRLGWTTERSITPTYIVNSGHGVHFYYVLEEPIILYKYIQPYITKLKNELVRKFWAEGKTSLTGNIDPQGATQSYRVVGSLTKLGKGYPTTAYRVGGKISLEVLNDSISDKPILQLPLESYRPKGKSGHDLAYWKEADPDWYRRKIENKPSENPKVRGRYPWLYKKMFEVTYQKSRVGNRWHCLTCLFSDAYFCGVSYEQALKDAKFFASIWNKDYEPGEKDSLGRVVYFSEEDVVAASKFYGKSEKPMRLETLQKKTGYDFESLRNKRNHRTRAEHLKRARVSLELDHPNGSWRNTNGRPTVEDTIRKYLDEHPDAKKVEIIRGTGVSKSAVYKWYKIIKGESNNSPTT